MVELRTALELYRSNYGSYPLAYPSAWGGVTTGGCGSGNGQTSGASAYITGLTPTYISILPTDPGTSASYNCQGYLYNSDGTNYKLLIHATWEGSYPSVGQPWYDSLRPTWALMLTSKYDLPPNDPTCLYASNGVDDSNPAHLQWTNMNILNTYAGNWPVCW